MEKISGLITLPYFCGVKTISQHIEKLLAQHDYVVVPELGGFVVQYQTAVISDERITPPLATVGFNPLMHHADGLLAIEIARAEGVSYRLAMQRIQSEVADLKALLKSSGAVAVGNLGTLFSTADGLHFVPATDAGFLPHNFQLTDLYVTPWSLRQTEESVVKRIVLPNRRFYKYAAVGLLAVGLFCTSPRLNDVGRSAQASVFSVISTVADTLFAREDAKAVESNSASVIAASKDTLTEVHQEEYHVVVASFETSKRALQYCEELKGTNPQVHVVEGKHKARVVLASFPEREEALKYMEQIRQTNDQFESAWVMCE